MAQTLQRVYADALFQLCCEEDNLDTVYDEITQVNRILADNEELVKLLASPTVSEDEKHDIISNIFKNRVCETTYNFISVIVDKGRIAYFDKIHAELKNEYNDKQNILEVEVITTEELSGVLREKLIAKLSSVSGKTIILKDTTDKSILGGIVIKYGNTQIDSSVKSKLDKLRAQIDSIIA